MKETTAAAAAHCEEQIAQRERLNIKVEKRAALENETMILQ